MARKIGTLTVDLRLVSEKFSAGLKKANGGLTSFRNSAQKATKSLGGAKAGIAGLLGVGGFAALIKGSLDSADKLAKMSDRLNIATESLSAFQRLAQLNGASSEQFEKALQRMSRSIGEAEQGLGTGKRALEALGISLDDLSGKSADEQFILISEAISNVDSANKQAALSSDLFGRAGIDLLNTIRQGRDGFEQAKDEVEKFGLAINRIDAAKIEMANDSILTAKQAVQGLAMTATVQLAPILQVVADKLSNYASQGTVFKDTFKEVVENVAVGVAFMSNAFNGLQIAIASVRAVIFTVANAFSQVFEFIYNDVVVPFGNRLIDGIKAPIKKSLEFFAQYSDTAANMLSRVDEIQLKTNKSFTMNALKMRNAMLSAQSDIYDALSDMIPIDDIREKLDLIFTEAEEKAIATAEKIQKGTTGITYANEEENTSEDDPVAKKESEYDAILDKERSFTSKLVQIKSSGSKKMAAITQAAALKEAITTGFAALQKAWNSAPFPANLPAVALTGLAVKENISAIRGQAHDGMDYIPREGTWLLDKGERVVDSRTNRDLKSFLANGAQSSNISISAPISIQGSADQDTIRSLERNQKRFARMVQAVVSKPI